MEVWVFPWFLLIATNLIRSEAEILISGKNTQKNYTDKGLNDPDNHESVITHTHLEPDILQSQVCLRKNHYKQTK